jgi:hypothetical protein
MRGPVIMLIKVTGYHVSPGRTSLTSRLFANVVFTAVCESPKLGQIRYGCCARLCFKACEFFGSIWPSSCFKSLDLLELNH